MGDLKVELVDRDGESKGTFNPASTMLLNDFYHHMVQEKHRYLKNPSVASLNPSDNLFLPAAGAGGEPLAIAKDRWNQPLSSLLPPPSAAADAPNTVTFILEPPTIALNAAGSGMTGELKDAGYTGALKRDRPAEYSFRPGTMVTHAMLGVSQLATTRSIAATRHVATLSAFAAACKTLEPDEDGHLAFVDGKRWWLLNLEKLFVRYFYKDLYENVLQKLGADVTVAMTRIWAIIGTPGIGKSAFGVYLLYQALRQDRCVVHVHGRKEQTMVFYPDGQAEQLVDWEEFSALDELDDPSTVLLLDSYPVHYCEAFTVLLTSPDSTRTHAFNEDSDVKSRRLYVPVFSKSEILAMHAACYSTTHDVNDVVALYNKWGGSARAVFHHNRGSEDMTEAVQTVDINYLRTWLPLPVKERSLDHSKVPSRLFRICTAADSAESKANASSLEFYAKTGVDFISPYVLWRVLERMRMVARSGLAAFVDLACTSPMLPRVFDRIFKRMCIDAFENGVKLVAYPLKHAAATAAEGAPVLVTFPKLKRNDVPSSKGFGSHDPTTLKHVIHVPTAKSSPAIDFAIDTIASVEPVELVELFSSAVVKVTFDGSHTTRWQAKDEIGLKATLAHWNPSVLSSKKAHKKLAFIWLVPDSTVVGAVVKANQSDYPALKHIDQYVACIDGLSSLSVTNALKEGKYEALEFTSVDPEDDGE